MNQRRKYYLDNLIMCFKSKFIKCIYFFLNKKIGDFKYSKYSLFMISRDVYIHFNRALLNKKIGEIMTFDISHKYFRDTPLDHNRKCIEKLCNETNDDAKKIFNALFNRTFLEYLEHMRGTKKIVELNGFEDYYYQIIKELKEQNEKDDAFLHQFIHIIYTYENIALKRRR